MIRSGQNIAVTSGWGERLRLVSYGREVDSVDLLDVLQVAKGEARFFWKNDLHPVAYAGFGIAAALTAEGQSRVARIQLQIDHLFEGAHLEGDLPSEARPRLFGGFAFSPHYAPSDIWAAFPSAGFVLPRVMLTQCDGKTWITISRNVSEAAEYAETVQSLKDDADSVLASLAFDPRQFSEQPSVISVDYPLAKDDWRQMIVDATRQIHEGKLEKVVLSRQAEVTLSEDADPVRVIRVLSKRYPDCYRFLLEVEAGHAFFGATPELLVEVHDSHLHTMALAGSRKRGLTPEDDMRLGQELMDSPKERHEHALVVESLRERITPYTQTLDIPAEPEIYRLQNIQHLYTPVRAELQTHFDVLDLVGELHPTPALGGSPRRLALEAIEQLEHQERGWYAAPVGWINADGDGMFAVAIRSAVSDGNRVRPYAGAGIVGDSDPDKEWDETRLKFKPLMEALGVNA